MSNHGTPSDWTFERLMAPMTTEEFCDGYYKTQPLYLPGERDRFASVMSFEILTALLKQTAVWTARNLQLVMDKRVLEPHEYEQNAAARAAAEHAWVDFDKTEAWLRQGASLVLNEIESLSPGLAAIANLLGTTPGGKVQANLYYSHRAHQAFDVHFDTHDVFALQISGEKRWRIYQRHFVDPIVHPVFKQLDRKFHYANKGAMETEVLMKPGDLIYLPSGFYHEALTETDISIHVTYNASSMVGLDVISALYEAGIHDELFRQSLPRGDDKMLAQRLAELHGKFGEIIRDPHFVDYLKQVMAEYTYTPNEISLPISDKPDTKP